MGCGKGSIACRASSKRAWDVCVTAWAHTHGTRVRTFRPPLPSLIICEALAGEEGEAPGQSRSGAVSGRGLGQDQTGDRGSGYSCCPLSPMAAAAAASCYSCCCSSKCVGRRVISGLHSHPEISFVPFFPPSLRGEKRTKPVPGSGLGGLVTSGTTLPCGRPWAWRLYLVLPFAARTQRSPSLSTSRFLFAIS